MKDKLTADYYANLLNGTLGKGVDPNEVIGRFALKAWNMKPNDIFAPILNGAKPNNYRVKKRGGIALIEDASKFKSDRYIEVENIDAAMTRIAKLHRSELKGEVIGITGSAGKSTTKTMLHHVLGKKYKTFQSMSNQNLTTYTKASLATLSTDVDYAIFEIAMYDEDTVRMSSELAKPEMAIITSIGMNHIENVGGSVENIIKAKTEIFDSLIGRGLVVLPSHDPNFEALLKRAQTTRPVKEIVTVGKNDTDLVQLLEHKESVSGSQVKARYGDQTIEFAISEPGYHFVLNSLLVLASLVKLELDPKLIKTLNTYEAPNSSIVRYRINFHDGREIELFDDAIISSPHQVHALLEILKKRTKPKRKVLVFGDMTALGEHSTQEHEALAPDIDAAGFDLVITVGEFSEKLGYKLKTPHITFPNSDYASQAILGLIKDKDLVAIKASGPTNMKLVIKQIFEHSQRKRAKSWNISDE